MVYVFLGNGFEDIEAIGTIDIIRRAGIEVKTVGVAGKTVTTAHGINLKADLTTNELKDDFDMIVLPGGMPGTLNLEKSADVQRMIDLAVKNNKYIAAICAAPSILGHKGLLRGKKAVCYPGFEKDLEGAKLQKTQACIDGKIITANGPGAVFAFANVIVKTLGGDADGVMSGMGAKL